MSLIYGVEFNNQTRALSFSDRAGNNIYSCTIPASHPLTFVSTEDGSTIWLFGNNATDVASIAQYEVDTGNGWTSYSISDKPHLTLNRGESCRWRCSQRTGVQTSSAYANFGMTGSFEAYGNIHSMLVPNFENITSLADYPYAFCNLFKNCKSLKKAPLLPATTLSEGCYRGLFDGSGIVYPPKLPATTLAIACYRSLFANCASLTQCTDLPATTLVQDCYRLLYYNAPLLAEAKIAATDITASNALSSWLYGSASVGNIYCDPSLSYPDGGSGIPSSWERWVYGATATGATTTMYHNGVAETVKVGTSSYGVCYSVQGWAGFKTLDQMHKAGFTFGAQVAVTMYYYDDPITAYSCAANADDVFTEVMYDVGNGKGYLDVSSQNYDGYYFESIPWPGLTLTATADNSSVSLTKVGTFSNSNIYKVNTGSGWTAYEFGTVIPLNAGESCKWRCLAHPTTQGTSNFVKFVMTGTIEASGEVYSMLSSSLSDVTTLNGYGNAFTGLFKGCTSLTKAPNLSATALSNSCYASMFSGCTSLTKAPNLPATALSDCCYEFMFKGCTSLTQAPELPATTLPQSCYGYMFDGCTSLTQAPDLPAATMQLYSCRRMFSGCTSLTKAPNLPATALSNSCYYEMFSGCTSLTQAPELPATTLQQQCYYNMFSGCTALTKVRIKATTTATSALGGWLTNVAATGTVYANPNFTLPTNSANGVPRGWTRKNIANYPNA